jgi:four helix bundle protein
MIWILDFRFWIGAGMNEIEFKRRTKDIALRVIRAVEASPGSKTADVIGRQVLRSAISVGANYRASCRAKSTADMIAKLAIVVKEGDETLCWLELLAEAGLVSEARLRKLIADIDEIAAMVVASIRTLRRRKR